MKHKEDRHMEISDCAYAVLKEKGYAGASLLTIAKAAKASNETLYRWYGSKIGLFEAMINDNALETREALDAAARSRTDPIETLRDMAPALLGMVLGDRAILLNRAAAADSSNELGQAIARNGRNEIAPRLGHVMERYAQGKDHCPNEMAETFIGLLIGDLQIRRVIGVLPEPGADDIQKRADAAIDRLIALYG